MAIFCQRPTLYGGFEHYGMSVAPPAGVDPNLALRAFTLSSPTISAIAVRMGQSKQSIYGEILDDARQIASFLPDVLLVRGWPDDPLEKREVVQEAILRAIADPRRGSTSFEGARRSIERAWDAGLGEDLSTLVKDPAHIWTSSFLSDLQRLLGSSPLWGDLSKSNRLAWLYYARERLGYVTKTSRHTPMQTIALKLDNLGKIYSVEDGPEITEEVEVAPSASLIHMSTWNPRALPMVARQTGSFFPADRPFVGRDVQQDPARRSSWSEATIRPDRSIGSGGAEFFLAAFAAALGVVVALRRH